MPDEHRSLCYVGPHYRITSRGRYHRGHFICSIQCWGKYWQSEWQRFEDERNKPKQQVSNLLELRRAK